MDSSVVDEDVVHLEVRPLTRLRTVELYKGVLETVSGLLVSDDFTALNLPEPGEDDLQILIRSHRVQFADEENVLRRSNLSIREISHHLQDGRPGFRLLIRQNLVNFLLSSALKIIDIFISSDPGAGQHLCARLWRILSQLETRGVIIGIVEDNCVGYPDVLVGPSLCISDGVVQLVDNLLPLHHLTKHTVLAVQAVQVGAEGDEELGAENILPAVDHADESLLGVFDPWNGLRLIIFGLRGEENIL